MPEPNAKTSDAVVSQEQLLPFLLNPRSYPHRPRTVRLVQTHASFVVIAPPFVYKVKKSVNFGFLNFSTLEKRRHYCQREATAAGQCAKVRAYGSLDQTVTRALQSLARIHVNSPCPSPCKLNLISSVPDSNK